MKILITGATGFLGQNLTCALQRDRHTVTVVGRDAKKLKECFPDDQIIKYWTDYSTASLLELVKEQDVVIHLASRLMQRDTHPLRLSDFNVNLELVENLVIAAEENNVKRFINVSSISVYPLGIRGKESEIVCPWNIYGVSKANIDTYLCYAQTRTKVELVSLRMARLFGYGERSGLMFTDFIERARQGKTLNIHGDGTATIEYIYINDAVEAIVSVLQAEKIEGVYNVGTGKAVSVREVAETVNDIFDNQRELNFVSVDRGSVNGTVMDLGKIDVDLGWCSKWSLRQSVTDIKSKIENG